MLVPNPKYHNALKRGASTHWIKKEVLLNPYNNPLPSELSSISGEFTTTVPLRDKQRIVFNDVVHRSSALIYAKTAFGKTVVLSALVQAWGGKTLILSHSKENVPYIQETIERFAKIPCGVYYSTKKTVLDVTVTTFASYRQKHDTDLKGFDNLIIDECDTFFSDKSRLVTCKYPAIRKVGLTGTIRTDFDLDNEPKILHAFYGHMHKVKDNIEDTPLKNVYYRPYKKIYKDDNDVIIGAYNWHEYRTLLDADMDRKKAMLKYIQERSNGFALVLFDRVADIDVFYRSSQARGIRCYKSWGGQPNKERLQHMQEFKANGGIMYAQYKTVGRGWDMPNLDKAFVLFPIKDESNIRQITGRVIREFGDKESTIYLLADSGLQFQLKKQKKTYKEFFNIDIIEI